VTNHINIKKLGMNYLTIRILKKTLFKKEDPFFIVLLLINTKCFVFKK